MVSLSNHDSLFNRQVILRQAQDDKLITVWATARPHVTDGRSREGAWLSQRGGTTKGTEGYGGLSRESAASVFH